MATPQQLAAEAVHRLPVIIQELPDLRYNDNDWTSKSGRQIAIGSIPVSDLAELCEVDRLEPGNQDGYQRVPTQNRISALRRDLQTNRVDLPTAILTNLRDFDADRHLDGTGPHFELVLDHTNRLYIVDGQHRVGALIDLYNENKEKWGDYALPFVCLLGADRDGEMNEFHVVNSNAKSIGTGLAYELLKRRAESSEVVKDRLVETGRAWVGAAAALTSKLSETTIWCDKIQFPGQSKTGTLLTNNGMVTSLRPLVDQPGYFKMSGEKQQLEILNAYWEGVNLVLPEVMGNPEKYNLQRTLGVTALHAVLVNVLAVMGSQEGVSVLDPNSYAKVMESPFNELGGYNKQGEWVVGSDFWKRGNEGASGLFSSRSGYRILQAQITENLPPISVR
jgi:DGQHR domain-containing protein